LLVLSLIVLFILILILNLVVLFILILILNLVVLFLTSIFLILVLNLILLLVLILRRGWRGLVDKEGAGEGEALARRGGRWRVWWKGK